MQCRFHKNTCCIMTDENNTEINPYWCTDCIIEMVIEHDNNLDNGIDSELNEGEN